MRWRKLGLIFKAAGQHPWMQSHCSMPFAEPVGGKIIRIWFTTRDDRNRSHVAWLEIDITDPQRILRLSDEPILSPGPPDQFDHMGVGASCIVPDTGTRRLYYIGWSHKGPDPYHIAIGLAVLRKENTAVVRQSGTPILDRSPEDPTMVSTPFVLRDQSHWYMWYLSVTDWPDPDQQPHYNLRCATSPDGITWRTHATPCIDIEHPTEVAIARPVVIRDDGLWRMWLCHRGTDYPYRVGYAESQDGDRWTRRDAMAGIHASKSGWDSEMIAYPYVFDHNDSRFMLYAGNGYGRDGMGLAILEED